MHFCFQNSPIFYLWLFLLGTPSLSGQTSDSGDNSGGTPSSASETTSLRGPENVWHSEAWQQSFSKGQDLWNSLQHALSTLPAWQCPDVQSWRPRVLDQPTFTQKYKLECEPDGLLGRLDGAETSGLPLHQRICKDYYFHVNMSTGVGLPSTSGREFYYENWYPAFSGAIVAADNVGGIKPDDIGPSRSTQPGGQGSSSHSNQPFAPLHDWYTAPNRWHEVVFAVWTQVCRAQKMPRSALKFVTRMKIKNTLANEIIDDIFENDEDVAYDDDIFYREFTPQDRDFYALLGTPNGSGVAKLLTQYVNAFTTMNDPTDSERITTVKNIAKITLVHFPHPIASESDFAVVLKDVDPPPRLPPPIIVPGSPPPYSGPPPPAPPPRPPGRDL